MSESRAEKKKTRDVIKARTTACNKRTERTADQEAAKTPPEAQPIHQPKKARTAARITEAEHAHAGKKNNMRSCGGDPVPQGFLLHTRLNLPFGLASP